jgi:YjbR
MGADIMRTADFRRIALGMKDAGEHEHMGHPDFRVNGRIFATLHGDDEWGMVKLTPEQQRDFLERDGTAFVPEKGAWGLQGCTAVRLDAVAEDMLGEAMTLAWRNIAHAPSRRPARARAAAARPRPRRR